MLSRKSLIRFIVAVCPILLPSALQADWPRFRGPNGSGVAADDQPTPVKWSDAENLKWKVALPGAGVSCPIVVGDRVYVTCYSGYGLDRGKPGDQKDLKRHLVCIDRGTGKIIWDKTVNPVLPEDPFSGMGVPEHGYASHTPVSDGKRIYVFFGKSGALAFDLDGNQLWQTSAGTESDPRGWGSASSPILFKNLLILTATAESEALVGLDSETGKQVWRAEAAGLNGVWGTPVLVKVDDNRTDLVVGVPNEIWGLNPETGKLVWFCEAMRTDQFNSSVVVHDGMVIAIEGRGGGSIAVRAGGKDDVTKTHVVWSGRDSNRFGTPVVYEGRVYFVANQMANCIDAQSGAKIFQSRLEGGSGGGAPGGGEAGPPGGGEKAGPAGPKGGGGAQPGGGGFGGRGGFGGGGGFGGRGGFGGGDYSSPVIADGKLYFLSRSGNMYVLKASDKFEQLAMNRVTADSEDFSASPAISDGQLFIRSNKHLYCVALKENK